MHTPNRREKLKQGDENKKGRLTMHVYRTRDINLSVFRAK
jgi:hypothetical protein